MSDPDRGKTFVTDQTPGNEIERLRGVALAAKALVQSAREPAMLVTLGDEQVVSEPALTALETALEVAGYGMTDEEAAELESRDV